VANFGVVRNSASYSRSSSKCSQSICSRYRVLSAEVGRGGRQVRTASLILVLAFLRTSIGAENGCPPSPCDSKWLFSYFFVHPPSLLYPLHTHSPPLILPFSLVPSGAVAWAALPNIFSLSRLLESSSSSSPSIDQVDMLRLQTTPSSSSDDSDGSDSESCFDTEDEVGETDSDTNPRDVDTNIE
jgi:hypothetical protein